MPNTGTKIQKTRKLTPEMVEEMMECWDNTPRTELAALLGISVATLYVYHKEYVKEQKQGAAIAHPGNDGVITADAENNREEEDKTNEVDPYNGNPHYKLPGTMNILTAVVRIIRDNINIFDRLAIDCDHKFDDMDLFPKCHNDKNLVGRCEWMSCPLSKEVQ